MKIQVNGNLLKAVLVVFGLGIAEIGQTEDRKMNIREIVAAEETDDSSIDMATTLSMNVSCHLDRCKIKYTHTTTGSILRIGPRNEKGIGDISYRIVCSGFFVKNYLILPQRVTKERRTEMAKLLIRLNNVLEEHAFEMNFSDGEIRLKTLIPAEAVMEGNSELFRSLMQSGIPVVRRAMKMIHCVAVDGKTAEEAI